MDCIGSINVDSMVGLLKSSFGQHSAGATTHARRLELIQRWLTIACDADRDAIQEPLALLSVLNDFLAAEGGNVAEIRTRALILCMLQRQQRNS